MEGEPANVTKRRKEFTALIDTAKNKIEKADKLHTEVTKYRTTAAQRVFGHVLHCEKIEVGIGEHKFTNDWSFILMDEDMVDWDKFLGNKLYVGWSFFKEKKTFLVFALSPSTDALFSYPQAGIRGLSSGQTLCSLSLKIARGTRSPRTTSSRSRASSPSPSSTLLRISTSTT